MSTITATNPLMPPATSAASTSASTGLPSGQQTQTQFLSLLVAQLKEQNPLDPQDGTQFVTQLAQFSSLEQLVNISTTLNTIATAPGTLGTAAATAATAAATAATTAATAATTAATAAAATTATNPFTGA